MRIAAFFAGRKSYHNLVQNGVNLYKNGVVNGVNHWEKDIQRIGLLDNDYRT